MERLSTAYFFTEELSTLKIAINFLLTQTGVQFCDRLYSCPDTTFIKRFIGYFC
jgi:hypothetical protein